MADAPKPLDGRTILVTGASRGLGYACAVAAAQAGAHIIATARTQGGLEELDDEIRAMGASATIVPMDMKAPDGIDQLGKAIFDRWGHLDGLIANAGLLGDTAPLAHTDPKSFDETFAVNVTANFRLIRSMDTLLRAAPSGRAVFISSISAQGRKAYWGSYAASKSALDAMATVYAEETEATNLRVNIVYPGPLRTQMRAKAMPGEDPATLPSPRQAAVHIIQMLDADYKQHGKIVDLRSVLS